ncbi:MAG: hypothetical protein ACI4KM_13045 [Oscillospiraceae bacterium]
MDMLSNIIIPYALEEPERPACMRVCRLCDLERSPPVNTEHI